VSRVGGNAQTKAMKKVAGRLRLDLAQYRELAAFAQFGSDLDKSTQAQLTRGQRMVELLKQDQFIPMPMEQQVMVLYAGTQGHLDDVPVNAVRRFESEFLAYLAQKYPDLAATVAKDKDLSDTSTKTLNAAIADFKASFKA
jgi:F-type H+-transporting ATPase subunit alpha